MYTLWYPARMDNAVKYGLIAAGGVGLALFARALIRQRDGRIPGTIFTILLENHSRDQVEGRAPYFDALAAANVSLERYESTLQPSLPNYIVLTSGATHGITTNTGHTIDVPNLAQQMDVAGIAWRAYGEGTSTPCDRRDHGRYAGRHMPFVWYQSVFGDPAFCAQHVVPFEQFWPDLAADTVKYMWITPDVCHQAHAPCPISEADAWLSQVVPRILASPGYQRGGVLFILFDERGNATPQLPAIVASPLLRTRGPQGDLLGHRSYLATVEDLLGLPRLATTVGATSMVGLLDV